MAQKFSWFTGVINTLAVGLLVTAGIASAAVPTFSQAGITVGLGQSLSVTSTNGVSVYMLSNSSPIIASISIDGAKITATGQALGSTTLRLCAVGTSSDCTSLVVVVQAGSVSGISFSQSNLSLSISGSQSITISGGNGTYTVSNNSNTSIASTNLSSSTLTVSGLAAGGATITVCDTANACGTLLVTVNSSSTSGLSFNQNNISLVTGGSQVVTVSGGNGTYNVSSNSNTSAVSANILGNRVNIYSLAAGNATITVCDTSSVCGTLNITVAASNANQAVTFSVTNPTLTVGQSLNVGLSGRATSYVILNNANANIVQASVTNGITLSLYGASAGTDLLTVCATGGDCSSISVTVTGTASTATTTAQTVPIAQTVVPTQSGTVVVNATLLAQIKSLQATVTQVLTQIQSIQAQLNQLEAQVNAGSRSMISTNTSASAVTNTSSGTSYSFTELLTVGSEDTEVFALQQRLTTLGFYSGPITGLYGPLTKQAVIKYQISHGIAATGSVGPSTRTALNAEK